MVKITNAMSRRQMQMCDMRKEKTLLVHRFQQELASASRDARGGNDEKLFGGDHENSL